MAKTNRPEIENPLAGMGLDDIVRGITTPEAPRKRETPRYEEAPRQPVRETHTYSEAADPDTFEGRLERYTGISEQGVAIWLPKEVKKQLEMIRINASRNIPLRSLAAAIITSYIAEHEDELGNL